MKKTAFSQPVFGKTISALLALGLAASSLTFGGAVSKLEYTRSLVDGLGFEVEDASDAYKRETTKEENIIYTAFQMGLLKGVSWDFENPITESEREIILGNAMAIYNQIHDTEDSKTADDSNAQESDSSETVQTNVEWESEWGTIKQPTDINVNEGLWTDEEFIQLIIETPESFSSRSDTLGHTIYINTKEDYENNRYTGWYLDTEKEQFFFEIGGAFDYELINMDEVTDGEFFHTLKVLSYHAYINGKHINIPRVYANAVNMFIADDGDYDKICYSFRYEEGTGTGAILYDGHGLVGFDKTKTPVQEEWRIDSLIPNENYEQFQYIFDGTEGSQARWGNALTEYEKSIDFVDQTFADFLYGVCDELYGADGAQVYTGMMKNYLKNRVYPRAEGEKLYILESQQFGDTWLHTVYSKWVKLFGITRK